MKRYSVKGTPEGFQVNEDEHGDFVAADEARDLIQALSDDKEALAKAIDLQREELETLKAGNAHKGQLEIIATPDRSPIAIWGSLAFAELPQATKNEIYMAYAKGVIDNDAQHPPRFVTKDTDTGETSVEDLARNSVVEGIAEKEDKKVLDTLKEELSDEEIEEIAEKLAAEGVTAEDLEDARKEEIEKARAAHRKDMEDCPDCGEFPCMEHAVCVDEDEEL